MKISILQLDLAAGDLEGNAKAIIEALKQAGAEGSELCITAELALIGHNVSDILLYPALYSRLERTIAMIARECGETGLILGTAGRRKTAAGEILLNQALLLHKGKIETSWEKALPTLEEQKYFSPGAQSGLISWRGSRFALRIGNDLFTLPLPEEADFLINIAANPFNAACNTEKLLGSFTARNHCRLLYANAVGACDGLIYPGQSACFQPDGEVSARARAFAVDLLSFNPDKAGTLAPPLADKEEGIFSALCLGVRDYSRKTGIPRAFVGLSGGVDSALVAVIACHALGPENVGGVLMPSPWSSDHSIADAHALAASLKMKTWFIPISELMHAFEKALAPAFADKKRDVSEENIQARIRGVLLMALANKFGAMLLATGNKSEISVGYSTLYGDTCGALEVIGDLYKTQVYKLCQWINARYEGLIPQNILIKAPSAELAPGQKDEDSLPPYPELDRLLAGMLDQRLGMDLLEEQGFAREQILRIARLVGIAQFKRAQSAPLLRLYPPPCLDMPVSGKFPF